MPASGNPPTRQSHASKLAFLDGLRGWASLWVVFNHLQNHLVNTLDSIPGIIRQPLIIWGGNGVFLFFAISGYVISRSLASVRVDGPAAANFGARRLLRLTPPYYFSIAFTLGVNYVSTVAKNEHFDVPSVGSFLANLVYLPALLNVRVINGTHWTLFIEMQFYLLIALLCWLLSTALFARHPVLRHTSMVVVGAVALIYPVFDLFDGLSSVFLTYFCSFVSGCFIYWFNSGVLKPWLFWAFTAGLLGSAIVHHREIYIAAALSHMLILGVSLMRSGFGRVLADRLSQFLGKISYSLYLTHAPLIGGVSYVGTRIFGDSHTAELLLAIPIVLSCIAVGYLCYLFVERPAIRWSRGLKRAEPTPVTA